MNAQKTITCTRCLGSGKYSYNMRDGDVCYGCGGAGIQAVTDKGKKVKPTSTINNAVVGDTIQQVNIYRIIAIIDKVIETPVSQAPINQKLTGQNIVTGKYAYFYRYNHTV